MSRSTERRWRPPDILVTLLAALIAITLLIWPIAYFLAITVISHGADESQWAALTPAETPEPTAAVWMTSVMLTLSAVLVTVAHRALFLRRGVMSLFAHGAAVVPAMAFVLVQVTVAQHQMFTPATLSEAYLSLLMGDHGLALVLGVLLLGASMILGAMRIQLGAMPANEAAIWFWHMLDTAWFMLIFIAYSGDLLQHL